MPFDLLASRNYINEISVYENAKVIIKNNNKQILQKI